MARNVFIGLLMVASCALISGTSLAAEPSLHQVYQAAEAGKMTEAQSMMREVLQAHPNSGKAHFVEAELLAKQGQRQKAEAELATAERLAPGLPFAQPQAVQNLKTLLGSSRTAMPIEIPPVLAAQPVHQSSFPWGMLLIGAGLLAFVVFVVRFMTQRNAMPQSNGGLPSGGVSAAAGYGAGSISSPYGTSMQPYGAAGSTPAGVPAAPGGLGSRVMTGLATGAAVGAGVVAGEALMHRFMGGKDEPSPRLVPKESLQSLQEASDSNDLGGSDFGVADSSSWDDNSDGGSDWT